MEVNTSGVMLIEEGTHGLILDDKTFRFSELSLVGGQLPEKTKKAMIFVVELGLETKHSSWYEKVEKKCAGSG